MMFDRPYKPEVETEGLIALLERNEPITAQNMFAVVGRIAGEWFSRARGSHAWDHTQRVCRLCEQIGAVEKGDLAVLRIAALLHDIGRSLQDRTQGALCHAEQGARLATPLVARLPLSPEQKQNVVHCIRAHRFRGTRAPDTLEAQILFDADKLDAIGAVGVARAFLFAGEVGARLHIPDVDIEDTRAYSMEDTGYREYRLKLRLIKDRMLTAAGKRMAQERHRFMEDFFIRFIAEVDGKG